MTGCSEPTVNHLLAHHCRTKYEAYVRGRVFHLGAFPAAVPTHHRWEQVRGLLLELIKPSYCLPLLDRYEGFDPHRPRSCTYRRAVTIA